MRFFKAVLDLSLSLNGFCPETAYVESGVSRSKDRRKQRVNLSVKIYRIN